MAGRAPLPLPPSQPPRPDRYQVQHGAIEPPEISLRHFRPAWRRCSRLDKLLLTRTLAPTEYSAALRYRQLWEIAFGSLLRVRGMPDGTGRQPQRSGAGVQPGEARLAAVESLARLARLLGPATIRLIELVVIEDRCWAEISRTLHVDAKTARARSVRAIKALATSSVV
jgi:hypothetical protein